MDFELEENYDRAFTWSFNDFTPPKLFVNLPELCDLPIHYAKKLIAGINQPRFPANAEFKSLCPPTVILIMAGEIQIFFSPNNRSFEPQSITMNTKQSNQRAQALYLPPSFDYHVMAEAASVYLIIDLK